VFNSAKAKSKAATAKKRHQKESKLQQMECDDAINQMQLTLKDNDKKALRVRKWQTAKSRASIKHHKKDCNKSRRWIQRNLQDLSVSAAKINDLEMKVASFDKTQAELMESHENAMAELLSQKSKVEQLVSTHAINLELEKSKLHQRLIREHQLQNELYKEVLVNRWLKRDACKSACLLKQLSTQQLEQMNEWRSKVSCDSL
jgi:hypothetical protein